MKLYNIKTFLFIFAIFAMSVQSCNDVLDLTPPQPNTTTFFATAEEVEAGLIGLYSPLFFMGGDGMPLIFYQEITLTDNGVYRFAGGARDAGAIEQISLGQHTAISGGIQGQYWNPLYSGINRANLFLASLEGAASVLSEEELNSARGQALTLRAYYYHYLIQFFGNVPFLDKPSSLKEPGYKPRTDRATIVQSLLADLDEAATLMPVQNSQHGRIDRAVALGLKARIALYAGEYEPSMFAVAAAAAKAVQEIAGEAGISLEPSYEDLFSSVDGEKSNEVMLTMPFTEDVETHNMITRLGWRGFGPFNQAHPTQNLVDAYPTINGLTIDRDPAYDPKNPWLNRDPRLKASILVPGSALDPAKSRPRLGLIFKSHVDSLNTVDEDGNPVLLNRQCPSFNRLLSGVTGYNWKKFADENLILNFSTTQEENDYFLMRYGEILLIRAEAEIEADGDLAAAAAALNELRNRAYTGSEVSAPQVAVGSQAEMRRTLRIERRIELALEGFRLIDLNRWKATEKTRNEPLRGRPLDLPNATNATMTPVIDDDGVTIYAHLNLSDPSVEREDPPASSADFPRYYDGSFGLNVTANASGVAEPDAKGNKYTVRSNFVDIFWTNFINRGFTGPRDYLLPIPQDEIDLFAEQGVVLTQNPGY